MAKFAVKGTDEYALKLQQLGKSMNSVAGKAIYSAADIVADKLKDNLEAIPAVDNKYNIFAHKKKRKSRISEAQKRGLIESFGVAKMDKDSNGYLNVKLGFDGYNSVRTRTYPKGQPNQLIARVLENGSSFMDAQPFVRPAVNETRKRAQVAMQDVIDEECKKIMDN